VLSNREPENLLYMSNRSLSPSLGPETYRYKSKLPSRRNKKSNVIMTMLPRVIHQFKKNLYINEEDVSNTSLKTFKLSSQLQRPDQSQFDEENKTFNRSPSNDNEQPLRMGTYSSPTLNLDAIRGGRHMDTLMPPSSPNDGKHSVSSRSNAGDTGGHRGRGGRAHRLMSD